MSKQTLAVIVGAIVLFVVAVIGAMAFTSGGDSGTPMMTMPDGSIMPADQMTTEGTHTMEDGSTMPDEEMEP
ncbi:MAG: hypothetical protein KatS3mg012_0673 [Gaiellaceae bacterium]|nr:MAG: hypothetical protein KatS3mg012_0673 [Gaiellaceae bacterium]